MIKTKQKVLSATMGILLSSVSLTASAGWFEDTWSDTKAFAASAWESVSDKTVELKDDVVESSSDSEVVEDVKKLGDKETYRNAWEGVKESAKNPSETHVDENGLPL